MGSKLNSPMMNSLFEGILKLETVDECYAFFEDLCTINELQSLAQRLYVARLLQIGKTYTEIGDETGVSTATISRVNRCLNYGTDGYKIVLKRLYKNED